MAIKPSVPTEWATQIDSSGASGNLNKVEPDQPFKDFGQAESGPVDRQSLNYQLNALHQWKEWSEQSIDELTEETSGIGVWTIVTNTTSTNLEAKGQYVSITSTINQDFVLPSSMSVGSSYLIYHAQFSLTNMCRVVNNDHTLIGTSLTLNAGDNLLLEKGFVVEIIPTTTTQAYLRITKVN